MAFQSLRKGHRFELQVAKWLTEVTQAPWFRVPMSGAAATSQKLENWHGDVYSETPEWKDLVVECKSYRKPVNLGDLNNPKSTFNSWVKQTEAEAGNKQWLLFFKSNRGPVFMLASTTDHLTYSNDKTLSRIFKACQLVARIREYCLFQLEG